MEPTFPHILIRMALMVLVIAGFAIALAVFAILLTRGVTGLWRPSRRRRQLTLLQQRRIAWGDAPPPPDDRKNPGRSVHEGGWRR